MILVSVREQKAEYLPIRSLNLPSICLERHRNPEKHHRLALDFDRNDATRVQTLARECPIEHERGAWRRSCHRVAVHELDVGDVEEDLGNLTITLKGDLWLW